MPPASAKEFTHPKGEAKISFKISSMYQGSSNVAAAGTGAGHFPLCHQ
jgi:hypothetical protein